jgi:hypothetical protein
MSNQDRDSNGRYIYSGDWERLCVCGHTLGVHTAEAPQACGTYGTGLLDCDCRQFKPAPQTKEKGNRIV